jgi:hypothetical protein
MSTIPFDTLKFVERLEAGGFSHQQAKAAAEAFADATSQELATKRDLEKVELSVRSEIELAKRDLKIWFGSVMVIAVGIILAAIRYLPPGH